MKAKTKRNWIFNLLAILGVVFAFSVGSTYAAVAFSLDVGSEIYSTASYLAKQEYAVINDTTSTPIAFGLGSRESEVSIQYSYSYDFDIRIKYSLSWSNSESTDNVILRYADRDSFIVDNEYIYYKDTISAGSGNLKIITGVDFVDATDSTYLGASLTISVDEVAVYKAQSSYSSSTLAVSGSTASEAWLWYKNSSSKEKAYAIVYNLRSTYDNGVDYPGAVGAYSRTYDGTKVTSASWLGGNRAYGGMGVYLITGNNAYTLKAKVTGAWKNASGVDGSVTTAEDGSSTSSAYIFTNSINFNYTSDWVSPVADENKIFETREYTYSIPANSAVYIELVDGIEITCEGRMKESTEAYKDYRVLSNIYLNDTAFLSGSKTGDADNNIYFVDGIASIDGLSNEGLSKSAYTKPTVSVYNTTTHNSALYNYHDKGSQDFYGNVTIVNNTANALSVSLSYKINIYYSNGNGAISSWVRKSITDVTTGLTITDKASSIVLAPYSSANVFEKYSLSIESNLSSSNNSDAWVEVIVTASSSTTTSTISNLPVEVGLSGNNYVLSVKNNTNATITGVTATISAISRKATFTLQTDTTEPNDWLSNFWEYYTSASLSSQLTVSQTWEANKFYSLSYGNTPVTLSYTTQNSFTSSTSGLSNSTIVLQPGESVIMATVVRPTDTEYVFTASATAKTIDANGKIDILFHGTSEAFIYNNTTSSYYIKFDGTMQTTQSNISTINSENYYVGVVRPGQIVKVPMSAKGNGTISTAVASSTYSLPTGWGSSGDSVDTMYKNYFAS